MKAMNKINAILCLLIIGVWFSFSATEYLPHHTEQRDDGKGYNPINETVYEWWVAPFIITVYIFLVFVAGLIVFAIPDERE